jgi:GrpB-like predicted nucleotidyltransferase (UPF0157 family)
MKRKIEVVDYDEVWFSEFRRFESFLIENLSKSLQIEHVGSTSVVGLVAKPILDIVIVVKNQKEFEIVKSDLHRIGYIHKGNQGIKNREVFKRIGNSGFYPHHLYVAYEGSLGLRNMLTIRDHLRDNSVDREIYGLLKMRLAKQYPYDIESYIDGKTDFLLEILGKYDFKTEDLLEIRMINKK